MTNRLKKNLSIVVSHGDIEFLGDLYTHNSTTLIHFCTVEIPAR